MTLREISEKPSLTIKQISSRRAVIQSRRFALRCDKVCMDFFKDTVCTSLMKARFMTHVRGLSSSSSYLHLSLSISRSRLWLV